MHVNSLSLCSENPASRRWLALVAQRRSVIITLNCRFSRNAVHTVVIEKEWSLSACALWRRPNPLKWPIVSSSTYYLIVVIPQNAAQCMTLTAVTLPARGGSVAPSVAAPFPSNISNASIGFSGQITPLNFPDLDPGGYTSLSLIRTPPARFWTCGFQTSFSTPTQSPISMNHKVSRSALSALSRF